MSHTLNLVIGDSASVQSVGFVELSQGLDNLLLSATLGHYARAFTVDPQESAYNQTGMQNRQCESPPVPNALIFGTLDCTWEQKNWEQSGNIPLPLFMARTMYC